MNDVPVERPTRSRGQLWAELFAGGALLAATLNVLWCFFLFGMRCFEACTESEGWNDHEYSWQWISIPTSGLLTFAAVVASIVVARKSGSRSAAAIVLYCVAVALALVPWVLIYSVTPT